MFKSGDLVFAKVRGHFPWPAKVLKKVSSNRYKVFFFRTKEYGFAKNDDVWDFDEMVEVFSSKYSSRPLYTSALELLKEQKHLKEIADKKRRHLKEIIAKNGKERYKGPFKADDLVFAKVRGCAPWPARIIQEVAPKSFHVFFFGTSETGKVKKSNVWKYEEKYEEFCVKYGERKSYALALEQIGEVACMASSQSKQRKSEGNVSFTSSGKVADAQKPTRNFVDDETVPAMMTMVNEFIEEPAVMRVDEQVIEESAVMRVDNEIIEDVPIVMRLDNEEIKELDVIRVDNEVIEEPTLMREDNEAIEEPAVLRADNEVIEVPAVMRVDNEVIEEIPRYDPVIKLTHFSITRTFSSKVSR